MQGAGGGGQLAPVVDAEHLLGLRVPEGGHLVTVAPQDLNQVGQVDLPLRIVGARPLQRVPQPGGVDAVDATVDLLDRLLLHRRVRFLDDAGHVSVVGADDPAVTARDVDDRGHQAEGRP